MTIRSDLIDSYLGNIVNEIPRRSCDRNILKPRERLNLMYFTVAQKFGRDLYIEAHQKYGGAFIPKLIGFKEDRYRKCIKAIQIAGIIDPTENTSRGEFKLPVIQNAYNNLSTLVNDTQFKAMRAVTLMEETDIKDLYMAVEEINKKELKKFLTNLLYTAYENFQTVVFKIEELTGQAYTAQVLTQAQVDKILGR